MGQIVKCRRHDYFWQPQFWLIEVHGGGAVAKHSRRRAPGGRQFFAI